MCECMYVCVCVCVCVCVGSVVGVRVRVNDQRYRTRAHGDVDEWVSNGGKRHCRLSAAVVVGERD